MSDYATAITRSAGHDALERARESFRRQAWGDAFAHYSTADGEAPFEPMDLAQFAQAGYLIGRDVEAAGILARAHQAFLRIGVPQAASRCAFWLGFTSLLNGEFAHAGGWLARASRVLEGQPESAENGYLLLPAGFRAMHSGDSATALATFAQAVAIGERFGEKDLTALALQGQGRTLIRQGEIERGVALLDEAMVSVTAGEVSPLSAGGVFCSVLEGCREIFDFERAQEWTLALERWCASQPDLVPYRGNCIVHKAELLKLHGSWQEALDWAQRAAEWFSSPKHKQELGGAFYEIAEIERLRGKFAASEEAYQRASQYNQAIGPGLAQLRLAQGRVEAANQAIRRLSEDVHEPARRAKILDAYVEIAIAAKDVEAAVTAAAELAEIAKCWDVPYVRALALRSSGAVLLASGNASEALAQLKQACAIWCELPTLYEAARARNILALAYKQLGDDENAAHETAAARQVFEQLGAAFDLSRLDTLARGEAASAQTPLSDRELEVLRLVASGMTNRSIAAKLHIAEKTVARHISNIFTKLDLSSRTAAAAYAYDHKLV